MKCSKVALLLAACLFITCSADIAQGRSAPRWVREAARLSVPAYDRGVSAVVLFDERITSVKRSGRAESRYRYVVRLLTREGRIAARRDVHYDNETSITKMRAWHVRSDGRVFKIESEDIKEESIADDLYSDSRTKTMRFPEADAGSIVAFEWVQKERPFMNQDYQFLQTRFPVVLSRYQLNLPGGWRVEPFVFNHPPLAPLVKGDKHTWEVKDLGPMKVEPLMPEISSIAPYIAVSYFPAHGKVARKSFSTWQDVSRWAYQLMDKQALPNAAIEQKSKELTAGLLSDVDKVRAISRWVQKEIRYVSIQLGAVGGYRPHAASVVFKKGYGDCKDKVCLMEAMLRCVHIQSYPVLVYSGDPTRIRREFPSALQFNHAIVAASIEGGWAGRSHAGVGDLIYFDPTDSLTPLGDLPYYLQGGLGLVVRPDSEGLVQLPDSSSEVNTARREIAAQVRAGGGVRASIKETLNGQEARLARSRDGSSDPSEYAKEVQSRVSRGIPGAIVGDMKVTEAANLVGPLTLDYSMEAAAYGNQTGDLLVIKPGAFWAATYPIFSDSSRTQPVVFDMEYLLEDKISITLPEGYRVDESPSNTDLKASFGDFKLTYTLSGTATGAQVVVERRMSLLKKVIPASDYLELKRFFDGVRDASEASVVLVKK